LQLEVRSSWLRSLGRGESLLRKSGFCSFAPSDRECVPMKPITSGSSRQRGNDPMLRPSFL
jgi:hypothetical protein